METRRVALRTVAVKSKDSNAGLWLDKFIAGQNLKDERVENSAGKFKQQLINEVAAIQTPDIYHGFFDRWQESLFSFGAKFKSLKIDGRMAVGLGSDGVLETSIAMHRTYGVPFIPGSALKGLAAAYAHRRLGDDWKKETENTKLGKAHEFVFGSQTSAGFVTFHDALLAPQIKNPLHADIMTVHHADYYGDKNVPPADWDSPVPISFLSATGDYLAAISGVEGAGKWTEFVWLILEKALEEEGIGAKTSSGYGRARLTDVYYKSPKLRDLEEKRIKAENERMIQEAEAAEQQAQVEKARQQEEFNAQIKAERQTANEQQQNAVELRVRGFFEQIEFITTATKKPEKIFENLVSSIYKVEDAGKKLDFYIAVLDQVKRLENEGVKINTSGKWFETVTKMTAKK